MTKTLLLLATLPWLIFGMATVMGGATAQDDVVPLPEGVKVVWELDRAWRLATPTREQACLNGLWRWQPADDFQGKVPQGTWGFFKVPGPWPGITDYMQKDFQRVIAHPAWGNLRLREVTAAWYERDFTVPAQWQGRRIFLQTAYLNSRATVFISGQKVGELRFPAGELELTPICQPGNTYRLSLFVEALPLKTVMTLYSDTAAPREVRGRVARRGLCGDIFLESRPLGPSLGRLRVETSVRQWQITFHQELFDLDPAKQYQLEVVILDNNELVQTLASPLFQNSDLQDNVYRWTASWKPHKLWDLHTPQHQYQAQVTLKEAPGRVLDVGYPQRFGFREFWIEGRDFYLNGSRIYLSILPLDNAQIGVLPASYEAACETFRRLRRIGINFVYTHNYSCEPGDHLSFEEILRAADDIGMLVALSQPHFSAYDWRGEDAEKTNGYAEHARFYTWVAGSHPSVVAYATSHNATGYAEDMNPFLMDGKSDPRDSWARNNAARALRAEAIIRRLDPSRIVYHHASGNLSCLHASNFYPNWVPIQEMDDWFGYWASVSVKPMVLCEYGAPFGWDWTMYRGWYRGARSFGSAVVPWDYSMAEWNAQFLGDQAYGLLSERQKANIRWEAQRFRRGDLWYRWDYPTPVGDRRLEDMDAVQALYLISNWRAFRTWGVSAISPWELYRFWRPRPDVNRSRRELPTDWEHLQRPGYSPDFIDQQFESIEHAFQWEDWLPTPTAEALLQNNGPVLAYLAGKTEAFTSKDHNFYPGQTVEKQVIIINNSRQMVTCRYQWTVTLPRPLRGEGEVRLPTGEQARATVRIPLPEDLPPGAYVIRLEANFDSGLLQTDKFTFHVLPLPPRVRSVAKVALYDPVGETAALLDRLGVDYVTVEPTAARWPDVDVVIIGKKALTLENRLPALERVKEGLRVLVFEQITAVIEKRLGFRPAEYGLRQVFPRVPDHPLLAGIAAEHLNNWCGEATLVPPRLEYRLSPRYAGSPVVDWCGIEVTRLWRCGCRGNVASVLPEKPARGNFLPIVDGGFSLQYAPLMEYREGAGLVLFCQLDVTGRTEPDPAAERIVRNLLTYVQSDLPSVPRRGLLYLGDPWGKRHLEHVGFQPETFRRELLTADKVLVIGKGGEQALAAHQQAVADFLQNGGAMVILGLTGPECQQFLPLQIQTKEREHLTAYFPPQSWKHVFAGVASADIHNRAPCPVPLVSSEAESLADGLLAELRLPSGGRVIFFQLPPYQLSRSEGRVARWNIDSSEAFEGKASALVSTGATTEFGIQFGQAVKFVPEVGASYCFSARVKPLRDPVTLRLEVERAGSPWDRACRGEPQTVFPGKWTEVSIAFRVEKPFPEGWQTYLACSQEGALFWVDDLRLYRVSAPEEKQADTAAESSAGPNLLRNPGFEDGPQGYFFQHRDQYNVRKTYRRLCYALTRVLGNLGVPSECPILNRLSQPPGADDRRYLSGLYADEPEEWDDPYRFFRW
jgi:hypothetical protein